MESIPTPLARAPNPAKIAAPEYCLEPQISNRCPCWYLWVTLGRGKGKNCFATVSVTLTKSGGSPKIDQISLRGIPKSINSASPI